MNRLKTIGRFLGKWVGYPSFFIFSFLLFAYWTFPYDRVVERIIFEVEYPQGPGGVRQASGYELEIISLEPSWFTGIEATGVNIREVATEDGEMPAEVTFETIEARIGLLSLLAGSTDVDFYAEFAGGSIEGNIESSEELKAIDTTITSLDLRRVGLLRGMLGLPITGNVSGVIALNLPSDPAMSSGNIDLRMDGVAIGDGVAKFEIRGVGELTIERLDAGDVHLVGAIEEGLLEIGTFEGRGTDIDLDGSGSLRIRDPFTASQMDFLLRADIKDSYRERNERTQAIFSLVDLNPRLQAAKAPDGALQYRLTGTPRGGFRGQPAGREPRPGSE